MNDRIQDFRKQVDLVEAANTELPKTKLNVVMTTEEARLLLSEVERLQRENERLNNEMDSMMITLEDRSPYAAQKYWEYLLNEKEKLVEALEWYADDRNYKLGNQTILGEKARTALSHLKG